MGAVNPAACPVEDVETNANCMMAAEVLARQQAPQAHDDSAPMDVGSATSIPAYNDNILDAAARFEREFDRCSTGLYRFFAVRTTDRHLADDLMQQLWIQARPGGLTLPEDRIERWIRAIAKNLVRTHWRRIARRPAHVPIGDSDLSASLSKRLIREELPAAELENREVTDQLLLAITSLSSADQDLIIGCYFDGLPQAALAGRLGISERAVEGRLYRARQSLRETLAEFE